MDESDTILAGEIKKGSVRALKELYDQYHKQLYYLAKQYLKNNELAEDAVQDVFFKIWDKKQNLDQNLSIDGLLFTMLKNHVLNMVRNRDKRKKILEEIKQNAETRQTIQTAEEKIIYAEYVTILNRGLNKLSPAKQEVYKLRTFEGLSNAEIAEKRNVSKHTVKTQYYVGSKHIRNYFKKHAGLFAFVSMLPGLQIMLF